MPKQCKSIECSNPVFSTGYCRYHQQERTDDKWLNKKSQSSLSSKLNRAPIKRYYKSTGELQLFLKIYADRKGICEITGKQIPFNVGSFAHILGKGAYPSSRLLEDNIIMVYKEIHDLYDNQGKDKLLAKYPKAIIIYERKEQLKHKYYNEKTGN